MRSRRQNRSRAEGEAMVAEYVESGRSQGEYCEERGIGLSTLQYWLRKIRAESDEEGLHPASEGFVELRVESPGRSNVKREQGQEEASTYEIVLRDGKRLRFRTGYQITEVAELVKVLEGERW